MQALIVIAFSETNCKSHLSLKLFRNLGINVSLTVAECMAQNTCVCVADTYVWRLGSRFIVPFLLVLTLVMQHLTFFFFTLFITFNFERFDCELHADLISSMASLI